MTRTLRRVHRIVWPILAVAVAAGLLLAVAWRKPAEAASRPAPLEQRA